MPQFMILLYDNPTDWQKVSPEEMQKAIEKYMAWTRKPFVVDSKRLAGDAGKVVRASGGAKRTTDGPYSEAKEVLGGYYTIEAANYDEAISRAQDHPHLDYGGVLVIRQTWTD
jgi:hypothetical protein